MSMSKSGFKRSIPKANPNWMWMFSGTVCFSSFWPNSVFPFIMNNSFFHFFLDFSFSLKINGSIDRSFDNNMQNVYWRHGKGQLENGSWIWKTCDVSLWYFNHIFEMFVIPDNIVSAHDNVIVNEIPIPSFATSDDLS